MRDISVYMQVYDKQRATFEALKLFRHFYKEEDITVVSDGGRDFSRICKSLGARYHHSDVTTTTQKMNLPGVYEYLSRIHSHCLHSSSHWVVLFEDDVRTMRPIRFFPSSECAGPRLNPYSAELTSTLESRFGPKAYGYGLCGASIFKRTSFIKAFENVRLLETYAALDSRVSQWSDVGLTLMFHISGFNYSVWSEVSELRHPTSPIVRDAAFDHAYKYWYDKEFDEEMCL